MGRRKGVVWHSRPEVLELRKEWYAKLKASGFKDIEHVDWSDGTSGNLLNGFSFMDAVRTFTPEAMEYYRQAEQWNHHLETTKSSAKLRKVWRLHSEGKSYRKIAAATGIDRVKVAGMIRKERERMLQSSRG